MATAIIIAISDQKHFTGSHIKLYLGIRTIYLRRLTRFQMREWKEQKWNRRHSFT